MRPTLPPHRSAHILGGGYTYYQWVALLRKGTELKPLSVPNAPLFVAERPRGRREPTSGLEPLSCSLRVSPFMIPNPARNRRFAGAYDSGLIATYLPIPLNIASTADATADNCGPGVSWGRLFCTGFVAVESSSTPMQLFGVCSVGLEPATYCSVVGGHTRTQDRSSLCSFR
jgi:hypothetical protein